LLAKYGNYKFSIFPLTISSEMKSKTGEKVVMCGFGAGLSWGTALLSLSDCNISPVIEY
jgi:3-oxoacyl-[acyl-carrier-protein] synthase-3